jgi:uncharacterized protein with GYD domain
VGQTLAIRSQWSSWWFRGAELGLCFRTLRQLREGWNSRHPTNEWCCDGQWDRHILAASLDFMKGQDFFERVKKEMASYLIQAKYTSEAFLALVKKPQDRTTAIKASVEKLGGSVVGQWGSFGEFDVVLIVDMPDAVSALAFKLAVLAGGAVKSSVFTPLVSVEEAAAAAKKAGSAGYKPPKA